MVISKFDAILVGLILEHRTRHLSLDRFLRLCIEFDVYLIELGSVNDKKMQITQITCEMCMLVRLEDWGISFLFNWSQHAIRVFYR